MSGGSIVIPGVQTSTPTVTLVGGAGNTVPVYTTNTLRYSKFGRKKVNLQILLDGDGGAEGAGTGQFNIALPIQAGASQPSGYFPAGSYINGTAFGVIFVQIAASGTTLSIARVNGGNFSTFQGADQNNTTRTISINLTYETI